MRLETGLIFIIAFCVLIGLFCFLFTNGPEPQTEAMSIEILSGEETESESSQPKTSLLFVGDIMLDRGVEYQIQKAGNDFFYPFKKIHSFLKKFDIVFGNLEGPIVKEPPYFSDESFKFAFHKETAKALKRANFGVLSLANNHTDNMGWGGLRETRFLLGEQGIDYVGEPSGCSQDAVLQKGRVHFLAFNKTYHFNCSDEAIANVVRGVRLQNPEGFLVVSIHWGEEYQLKSSASQKDLGHKIIEAGANLIIGHHPHVVQEVELYKEKLIFYSLGNFIFDQQFSTQTQQGLAVGLELSSYFLSPSGESGQTAVLQLFPVYIGLSQPFLMEKSEANAFLQGLALKSSPKLVDKIKKGIIEVAIP